ncbi:hypothetical protein ES703_121994 [subsurface metagenome]
MWPKSGLSLGCGLGAKKTWKVAISYILDLEYGGFLYWQMPNLNELLSICNHSEVNPAIWSPFTDVQTDNYSGYWTSTTYKSNTLNAWIVRFIDGYGYALLKSLTTYIRPVRRFV